MNNQTRLHIARKRTRACATHPILAFLFPAVLFAIAALPAFSATPVLFTTQPRKVQNVAVYVDGALQCTTGADGDCSTVPNVTAGLHKADYIWATCNSPSLCPAYGMTTIYVLVPDQPTVFAVRIPSVRVRWYTEANVRVSLNSQLAAGPATQETGATEYMATANVLSGCYTASYFKPAGPIPDWPSSIPGTPDPALQGFDLLCFGSDEIYPPPVPDNGNDLNPPEVRVRTGTSGNTPPLVDAASSAVSVPEGTPATNSGTWSDADLDAATISANTGTVTQGTGTWAWSNPSLDDDSYTVVITADDGKGGVATTTFSVTVTNVNPSITGITVPPTVALGSTANVSATFTDPGILDTHSCTWYWGNGSTSAGTVSSHTCTGSKNYMAAGEYTVSVIVTDDNGGSGQGTAATSIKVAAASSVSFSGMPGEGCTLWPPNKKMVQVATIKAAAPGGIAPGSFKVTGTSNEPQDAKQPDIAIAPVAGGGFTVQLRADRLGTGTGRIYTITATAKDLAGNTATATSICRVPHDQGK